MTRFMTIVGVAVAAAMVPAQAALAATHYPSSPSVEPTVLPLVVHRTGGTAGSAFTGADLMLGFVSLAVLVLAGLAALYVTRRRAAKSAA
jgi:hypothetical protein